MGCFVIFLHFVTVTISYAYSKVSTFQPDGNSISTCLLWSNSLSLLCSIYWLRHFQVTLSVIDNTVIVFLVLLYLVEASRSPISSKIFIYMNKLKTYLGTIQVEHATGPISLRMLNGTWDVCLLCHSLCSLEHSPLRIEDHPDPVGLL